MKLLLTSNGLSNDSISKALVELVGKSATETTVAFIPTAMNITTGDKEWFIHDLSNIQKQEFENIDIVDISALPRDVWRPRLKAADVLFFEGGSTFHLMRWIRESGLIDLLPEMLKTKVWVGSSAGAMVTNPALSLSTKDVKIYYEETFGSASEIGLGLVDFYIRPHLNSPDFPNATKEYLENIAKDISGVMYGLDDNSALKVIDGQVEIISEGEYLILNERK